MAKPNEMQALVNLYRKIEARAEMIAMSVADEINTACVGHPQFAVIMFQAVERKITDERYAAQQKAAGMKP